MVVVVVARPPSFFFLSSPGGAARACVGAPGRTIIHSSPCPFVSSSCLFQQLMPQCRPPAGHLLGLRWRRKVAGCRLRLLLVVMMTGAAASVRSPTF